MAITPEQLDLQLERLEETFGEKNFSPQRSRMIWLSIEGLEYADVIGIVDKFIRENTYAPLPKDFLEAAREYSRSATSWSLGEIRPMDVANCRDCGDSGFVHIERLAVYAEWAKWAAGSMPCHCSRGRDLIEAARHRAKGAIDLGAQWGGQFAANYKIIPAYFGVSTFSGREA